MRPRRMGNKYAAPPIDQNKVDAKNAPTDPMRFLDGGAAPVPALSSPGTKDTMLSSVKSANAIRTTPITSRLMCDGGEAAPRASPRLAEVVTAMIAMLAQGIGHFKRRGGGSLDHPPCSRRRGGMEADDLLCSRNARSRTPLVGRAQWKINQPPSLKRERASLEGSSVTSFDARTRGSTRLPLKRKDGIGRTRAVGDPLARP